MDPGDGEAASHGTWTSRLLISRANGAEHITLAVNHYARGRSPAVANPQAEEVLYAANGSGECLIDGSPHELAPGTAVFIPPGAEYAIDNSGDEPLRIVSACCPEDPGRRVGAQPSARVSGDGRRLAVREQDRDVIRAGKDREFRYLIHTDLGCRQITQFAGWIPQSVAPFHYHEYEEGIFILDGSGIVHVEDETHPFGPGSSIYLPIGVRHCLENPGPAPVRLLGVFYPSGSPGAAYEE
jgi:mannose-6-phosphate isomerase-like protein (cupin superfamily)